MSDKHAFTRRQFLHTGLAMLSTVGSVPGFLPNAAAAMTDVDSLVKNKPGVPDDRVLVVVQLSGGNDGLNTVIPFGMREYYNARPNIAVPERDLLVVDPNTGIGLHPGLRDLYEMLGERRATILQGVGYPNPNRSHFASMDVWHSGITDTSGSGQRGRGWIGRALDHARQNDITTDAHGMECITLGTTAPLATLGRDVRPVTFQRPNLFRWHGGNQDETLTSTYNQLLEQTSQSPRSASVGTPNGTPKEDDPAAFIFRTALDAQVASTKVRQAVQQESKTRFPGGPLSSQLETVAAMIRAELPTRVYYVALGGFDTHANQFGPHNNLLQQFAGSVRAFYRELDATGHGHRVVTMAFSEFGRRVRQNASQGTDHGAAGPMFLFGDHARPGLLGDHPSMSNLENGDITYNIDFRSVYRDVLENWMKLNGDAAFARTVQPAGIVHV
ncbi:DUF1501 domain-containing protein [Phycisphaerales bacterium AB-hyl4]|uniref:DUF1501 domain-containing protein n=1 Tax=Natronomicrosphaera hydrolytica TaxID=3242702 RepID=A0ABV4UAR6_9BACT